MGGDSNYQGGSGITLGKYLAQARVKTGLSLREVENATGKEVSNAYLSQLEKDKIAKPSPNMLHALSNVYGTPYETLMQHAGYITGERANHTVTAEGPGILTIKNVTPEEEKEILKFVEYLRFNSRR